MASMSTQEELALNQKSKRDQPKVMNVDLSELMQRHDGAAIERTMGEVCLCFML